MEPLHALLIAMASEQSGVSSYWRERIQVFLDATPQEPRYWVEVVEEKILENNQSEVPPVAETD